MERGYAVAEGLIGFVYGQDFKNMNLPEECFTENGRIIRWLYSSTNEKDFYSEQDQIVQKLKMWVNQLPVNPLVSVNEAE